MFRAEIHYQEVLAYAEYNRTCFKVVAATSRDVPRDTSRDTLRDIEISREIVHVTS
jgi:hypothetical protein